MDYIYYHCLRDLVLLAGSDLQEPNLFHQVQLYSHFPELKCNSLTFNATANCLSKKRRGVSPPAADLTSLMAQLTQTPMSAKCCWKSITHAKCWTAPPSGSKPFPGFQESCGLESSWKPSGGGSALVVSTWPDNFLVPVCVSALWSVSAPWTESHGLASVIFATCSNRL